MMVTVLLRENSLITEYVVSSSELVVKMSSVYELVIC